jgi:hypothetical protein
MAKDHARFEAERRDPANEEARTLLADDHGGSSSGSDVDDHDLPSPKHSPPQYLNGRPKTLRQSSLAQARRDGTPRTPNRVRFDVSDDEGDDDGPGNGHTNGSAWIDDEDYLTSGRGSPGAGRDGGVSYPLLTGIEAPSITVATFEEDFNEEDLLESARPKSGMKSAFMNMANSIMYASPFQAVDPRHAGFHLLHMSLMPFQWRRNYRSTLCFPTGRLDGRYGSARWIDGDSRLDHPADRHQFEAQWRQFLPRDCSTLFWKDWVDCDIISPVGIVSCPGSGRDRGTRLMDTVHLVACWRLTSSLEIPSLEFSLLCFLA